MTAEARRAIRAVRDCLELDRFALTVHFSRRMQERGLFWPDVVAVIDDPDWIDSQGMDEYNRPKWLICGKTTINVELEIVCAIESDETQTEFITLYWKD